MQREINQNKKLYLEVIRILAVLLVIFNHTDGFVYYTVPGNIITHLYSLILAIVCRMAVPLFFMVSGTLLLKKEEKTGELLKRRVWRMLVVLLAVSVFYYVLDIARGRIGTPGVGDFFARLASNGIRESFWFLYLYISALLLLPFFRKVASGLDKNLIIYLVAVRAFVDIVIFFLQMKTGLAVSFDAGFIGGCFYYLLIGYYIDEGKAGLFKNPGVKGSVLLSGMIILNGILVYSVKKVTGEYQTLVLDVFVFLTAPLAFGLIQKCMEGRTLSSRAEGIILTMGSCVFGIYLLDNFFRLEFLPVYLFMSEKTVGIIANSVYVLLTFAGGLTGAWILKKIPVVKNYL